MTTNHDPGRGLAMTDAEALRYAIDWLRAFPALPTAAPHVREERRAAVERLEGLLRLRAVCEACQHEGAHGDCFCPVREWVGHHTCGGSR